MSSIKNTQNKALSYLWILLSALFFMVVIKNLIIDKKINSDIASILPKKNKEVAELNAVVNQIANNKLILLLKNTNEEQIILSAQKVKQQLLQSNIFNTNELSEDSNQALYQLLVSNPVAFLTKEDQVLLKNEQYQVFTQKRIAQLYSPFSSVSSQKLNQDPLFLSDAYFSKLTNILTGARQYQEFLGYAYNQHHYIIFNLELNDSAFNLDLQRHYLQEITAIKQVAYESGSEILQSGVIAFSAAETAQGLKEAQTIGYGSLLAILVLISLIFRSLIPSLILLLVIAIGVVSALAVASMIFSELHVFSILVGASLVGIAVDYVFHYLAKNTEVTTEKVIKLIIKPISLGLITSVFGYLALLFSGLIVLQQIALISIVGLIAAYITSLLLLPSIGYDLSKRHLVSYQVFVRLNQFITRKEYVYLAKSLAYLFLVISVISILTIDFDDRVESLHASPQDLRLEQQEVEQVLSTGTDKSTLLLKAQSKNQLLQNLEQLTSQLDTLIGQGRLASYISLNQIIASKQQQQTNYQLLQAWANSQAKEQYASLVGPDRLNHYLATLNAPTEFNKTIYKATSLEPLINQLLIESEKQQFYGLIQLQGLEQQTAIQQLVEANEQLYLLDATGLFSSFLQLVRENSIKLVIAAYLFILIFLVFIYGPKKAWLVFLPPLSAALLSLSMAHMLGQSINIFHIVALTLVLGIGIDYTIFYSKTKKQASTDTVLAVTCSMISTVLAFGLMSFSQTPAVAGFGTIVLFGMIVVFLLAPMAIRSDS